MGLGKWIGGIVGFMSMGPLGALAGYALGSLFDNATSFSVGFGIIHHPRRRKDYAQRNGVRASLSQK